MKKKISIALASISLCVSMAGCTTGETTGGEGNNNIPEMPTYSTTETFRIGNWGVPPHANSGYMEYANNPDYCTEEHWTNLKNCGFNLAFLITLI